MKSISSRDNPVFKGLKKLAQSARHRKQSGQIVLEGLHLLLAYEATDGEFKQIVVSQRGGQADEIKEWLSKHGNLEVIQLTDSLYDDIAATETPSGILALVDIPHAAALPDLQSDAVLLDGIQDPGNVGTLLRTALAAGFGQVLLSPNCASVWSPKVLRSAQGAHFSLAIYEGISLPEFVTKYSGTVLATALENSRDLYQAEWQAPVAWVFGSEGQGVSEQVLARAALKVRIPMAGPVESLNVGAAAAICLFETLRRRLR